MLEVIAVRLRSDDRFPAAWLSGSIGRGEEDAYSDVDIVVAVSANASHALCSSDRQTGAGSTRPRMVIISSFGEPAIVHEQHANAPPGGAFTAVVYESGIAVDWTFVPVAGLKRPSDTRLLYDHFGVPVEQRTKQVDAANITDRLNERLAFFWLLSISAAKAWRRGDGVRFHQILELMYGARRDIRYLLRGEEPGYTRHSLAPFSTTADEQRRALQNVCEEIVGLSSQGTRSGSVSPDSPIRPMRRWLEL